MHDLPTGPALLALARDVLLNELLPLLPPEVRLEARLVANSMAIAEREAAAAERSALEIIGDLEIFYRGEPDALRRFACDLRVGAFEDCQHRNRGARDILWRLTIAKLRLANPRFLAANGFS